MRNAIVVIVVTFTATRLHAYRLYCCVSNIVMLAFAAGHDTRIAASIVVFRICAKELLVIEIGREEI